MYPGHFAVRTPERPAVVMSDSGATLTYAELDERSIRPARVLRAAGLRPGDDVAVRLTLPDWRRGNARTELDDIPTVEALWRAPRAVTDEPRRTVGAEDAY